MKYIICAAAGAALAGFVFSAQADEERVEGWSGEGALSAGMTSGNTDTRDIGLTFDVDHIIGKWDYGFQGQVDYGEQDGLESRNRVFLGTNLDYTINDGVFSFARASYEVDQFTGFDSRSFVGGGLGYRFPRLDPITWVLRGGPGVKIDEVKRVVTTDDLGAPVIIPAETVTSVGFVGKSKFAWALNDKVELSNNTDVLYAEESTQLSNALALTAQINGSLSARFGFDTRYDTNPPLGYETTDTATKIGVVYKFGAH
jgi:putative salt-induced outer membrane protein